MKVMKSSYSVNNNAKQQSFGSSFTSVLGKKILSSDSFRKVSSVLEYNKYTMSTFTLASVLYGATVLPRYIQAKDKHDRREILTRDVLSITSILFGAKALSKGFSELFSKTSGFVLNNKPHKYGHKNVLQKFVDYINPTGGIKLLSSGELVAKYSNIEGFHNGMSDFINFIEHQKGDLKKVLSTDKNIKAHTETILGKDIKSSTMEEIKDAFERAKGSTELKEIFKILSNPDNKLVRKAKTMNSAFDFASTVLLVPAFMIWIEKYNEKVTKRKIAEEKAAHEKEQPAVQESKTAPAVFNSIKSAQNSSSDKTKQTYASFLGESK